MKRCGYCGRENEDVSLHCVECGSEFPRLVPEQAEEQQPQQPPVHIPEPRLLSLEALESAFLPTETFTKPDWQAIEELITRSVARR